MIKTILAVFVVSWISLEAQVPEDAQVQNFSCHGSFYEWESDPDRGTFKRVVLDAVYECYKEIPLSELGLNEGMDLKEALSDQLNGEVDAVASSLKAPGSQLRLVTAKRQGRPVGYAVFDLSNYPDFIYISYLAVDPAFQRQKIGEHLVYSILKPFPDAKKLVLVTRKANWQACAFYPAIGFKSSDYINPQYDPTLYTGFEYVNGG